MKGFSFSFALVLFAFASFVFLQGADDSNPFDSLRDPDVFYFEGKPSEFPVVQTESLTPLFTDKDLRSLIQNLPKGTRMRVIGWHEQGWLVQSTDRASTWEGWVTSNTIQSITPEELQKWREKSEHQKIVQTAIKEKKILPGMTYEDVHQALGKPNQTFFRQDDKGKIEIWSYIRYESVPQTEWSRDVYGRVFQTTTMIRIPKGEIKVEFKEGKVVAYEEKK